MGDKTRLDNVIAGDVQARKNAVVRQAQQAILAELRKGVLDIAPDIDVIRSNVAILEEAGSAAFKPLMGAMRAGKDRASDAIAVISASLRIAHQRESTGDRVAARDNDLWRE